MYHYPLTYPNNSEVISKLKKILKTFSDKKIKINLLFGYILRHKFTEDLKFFECFSNLPLFERPKTIYNPDDNEKVMDDIEHQNLFDCAFCQRPSAKWLVENVVCVQFVIYRQDVVRCGRCFKYIPMKQYYRKCHHKRCT